jgi:tetratricopeptide (TPR) repeat protein
MLPPLPGTRPLCILAFILLSVTLCRAEGTKVASPTAARPADPAVAKAEADVAASPESAPARARLGYLLVEKGELDAADRIFDEALKRNPRSFDAKIGKGAVLARRGKVKEAEEALREALVLNPNPVRAHYELGLLYQKAGEFEKAVAEFKEGIRKHEQGRM